MFLSFLNELIISCILNKYGIRGSIEIIMFLENPDACQSFDKKSAIIMMSFVTIINLNKTTKIY